MQNFKLRILVLFLLIFLVETNVLAQKDKEQWIFLKESNEISIYYRTPENSAIKELKLSTISKTTPSAIVSVISDIDLMPQWAYVCVETNLIKLVSQDEWYYYYISDAPWPLMDRDMVIHVKVSQDSTSRVVTINTENCNGLVAEKDDYIRIKKLIGKWVLTPLIDGLVQIELYISMDPGGIIPTWIINSAMSYGPIKTITSLKEILEEKSAIRQKNRLH